MRKLLSRERGFTVIEAVVAQGILILGAVSIWSVFVLGARLDAEAEDKTIAANIAQLKMESIMNTRFRYIVSENPAGTTWFNNLPQQSPYWVLSSNGTWVTALPEGRYEVSYPGPNGENSDPLVIRVKVLWLGRTGSVSSLTLESLVSMTPGRFRG